jgi:hypothetical protein
LRCGGGVPSGQTIPHGDTSRAQSLIVETKFSCQVTQPKHFDSITFLAGVCLAVQLDHLLEPNTFRTRLESNNNSNPRVQLSSR